jgi:hypothetical protein
MTSLILIEYTAMRFIMFTRYALTQPFFITILDFVQLQYARREWRISQNSGSFKWHWRSYENTIWSSDYYVSSRLATLLHRLWWPQFSSSERDICSCQRILGIKAWRITMIHFWGSWTPSRNGGEHRSSWKNRILHLDTALIQMPVNNDLHVGTKLLLYDRFITPGT